MVKPLRDRIIQGIDLGAVLDSLDLEILNNPISHVTICEA
jgi:hypothetical protein